MPSLSQFNYFNRAAPAAARPANWWFALNKFALVIASGFMASAFVAGAESTDHCLLDLRFEGHFASEAPAFAEVGYVLPYTGPAASRFVTNGTSGRAARFQPIGAEHIPTVIKFNASPEGLGARLKKLSSFTAIGWWRFDQAPAGELTLFRHGGGRDGFALVIQGDGRLSLQVGGKVVASATAPLTIEPGSWQLVGISFCGGEHGRVAFYSGADPARPRLLKISAQDGPFPVIESALASFALGDSSKAWSGALDSFKLFGDTNGSAGALDEAQIAYFSSQHESRLMGNTAERALRKSDVVIMRSSSAAPVMAYGATRVAWNYQAETGLVEGYAALGVAFSQTFNLTVNGAQGAPTRDSMRGRALDFDGRLLVNPTQSSEACSAAASSEFRDDVELRYRERLLPLGAASIQNDDPMMDRHYSALGRGPAGFDPDTLTGFRTYLAKKYSASELQTRFGIESIADFDYREWLRRTQGITNSEAYRAKYGKISLAREMEDFQEARTVELVSDLRKLCHQQTPAVLLSANVLAQTKYYRRLFPAVDFFCSETPGAKVTGVLDAQDTILAKLADATGTTVIAVNNPQATKWIEDHHATVFNRMLVAALYAHGELMMAPWDIWAGFDKAAGVHRRYYGSPADYAPTFHWIRREAALFDRYESMAQIALLWNSDTEMKDILPPATSLLAQHMAFDLLPLGDRYPAISFDPATVAARYAAIATSSDISSWSTGNQAIVQDLAARRTLGRQGDKGFPSPWFGVKGTDAESIWLSPRRNRGDARAPIVLHVLNRRYDARNDRANPSGVIVEISREFAGFALATRVRWTSPEGEREVMLEQAGENYRLHLDNVPLWSILVLSPAPSGSGIL